MHRTQTALDSPYPARLYLHALVVEDITIQSVLLESAPLFISAHTGLDGPNADKSALHLYAQAVYEATDAFLAQLPEDGLHRVVNLHSLGLGQRTVAWIIQRFIVGELKRIASAISAASANTSSQRHPPLLQTPSRRRSLRIVPSLVSQYRYPQ
jgi:hypothetical protein